MKGEELGQVKRKTKRVGSDKRQRSGEGKGYFLPWGRAIMLSLEPSIILVSTK